MASSEEIRIPVAELNRLLSCKLCLGYFQDAHTITECMHTFCRNCIIQYFDRLNNGRIIPCPTCGTHVGYYHIVKTKIIFDRNIQSIVDKIFPSDASDTRQIQQQLQQQISGPIVYAKSIEGMDFTVKTIPDESCDEISRLPAIPKPSFKGKWDISVKKIQKFIAARLEASIQEAINHSDGIDILYEGMVVDPKSSLVQFRSFMSGNINCSSKGNNEDHNTNLPTLLLHYRRKLF